MIAKFGNNINVIHQDAFSEIQIYISYYMRIFFGKFGIGNFIPNSEKMDWIFETLEVRKFGTPLGTPQNS